MLTDDLSKVQRVELTIDVLKHALQQLHKHEYTSAQAMVAIARRSLETLQADFDYHFEVEAKLKQMLR